MVRDLPPVPCTARRLWQLANPVKSAGIICPQAISEEIGRVSQRVCSQRNPNRTGQIRAGLHHNRLAFSPAHVKAKLPSLDTKAFRHYLGKPMRGRHPIHIWPQARRLRPSRRSRTVIGSQIARPPIKYKPDCIGCIPLEIDACQIIAPRECTIPDVGYAHRDSYGGKIIDVIKRPGLNFRDPLAQYIGRNNGIVP